MKQLPNFLTKLKEGYELALWVVGIVTALGFATEKFGIPGQFQTILFQPLGVALVVLLVVCLAASLWGIRALRLLREELNEKSKKLDDLEIQFSKGSFSGPEFQLEKLIWRPILIRVDGGERDTVRVKGPMCPECKTPLSEIVEKDPAKPLAEHFGYCANCPSHISIENISFAELTADATAVAIGRYERGELKFSSKRNVVGATVKPPTKPRLMDRPNDDLTV